MELDLEIIEITNKANFTGLFTEKSVNFIDFTFEAIELGGTNYKNDFNILLYNKLGQYKTGFELGITLSRCRYTLPMILFLSKLKKLENSICNDPNNIEKIQNLEKTYGRGVTFVVHGGTITKEICEFFGVKDFPKVLLDRDTPESIVFEFINILIHNRRSKLFKATVNSVLSK